MAKPNVTATGLLILATGRYFQVRHGETGHAEFLLPDGHGDYEALLQKRVKEMRETAAQWNRQADLLAAGLAFEKATRALDRVPNKA